MLIPILLVSGAVLLAGLLLLLVQPSATTEPAVVVDKGVASVKVKDQVKPRVAGFENSGGFGAPTPMQPDAGRGYSAGGIDSAEGLAEEVPAEAASWEAPINTILESAEDNDTAAMKLDALAPTLPLDGQLEAAQHMVNLLGDDNYQIALQKLVNTATPTDVMEVIYSDVLNRPNAVKLPALVNVLNVPGHPLRAEALETLQIFVGRDLGNDTQAWSAAVQEFLQKEAQEDAEFADQ